MAELSLPDMFNDCVDRLAAGQSIDACLRAYPGQAARLRPMLESGLVAVRVAYPAADVMLAQERIWSRVEQAYNAPLPTRQFRFPRQYLWLAAVLAGLLILAGVMAAAQNSAPGDPLYGVRMFIESIFGGAPSPTPIPTETPTLTPSSTETAVLTLTGTATPLPAATETATMTASAVPSETPVSSATPPEATEEVTESITGVIEGPVEAIDGNVVTIYGIEIAIDPDDPLLAVIEVDDMIRVEGDFTGAGVTIVAGDVTVVGTDDEVFLNDAGEVWRDDGTCNNPPPDWAPANGWRRRCQGGNSAQPGNQGQGMGSGASGMGMGSGS